MRNLKRVLSLALALVMVLGMMVIGTSAATFTDAEEITYTEAVDVASAIGVINGYPAADGTFYFDADGVLTREQGAALICYLLLGKTTADKLVGSGNFTDVAADRWSAGEIDYCANLGIVKGNPDGTFAPEAPLTALAYGRMLLGALGYDGDVEGYVGANWATAITTDMIDAGLEVKGVAMDAQLTREQAAQMTLQALQANMVGYTTKGTSITVGGVVITSGASEAAPALQGDVYADVYGGTKAATLQFSEKYFPELKKDAGQGDAYGRPASYRWYIDAVANDGNFNVLKDTVVTNVMKKAAYTVNVTGVTNDTLAEILAALELEKASDSVTMDSAVKGDTVELYLNTAGKVEKAVKLHTELGQISKVTKTTDKDAKYTYMVSVKTASGIANYKDTALTGFDAATMVANTYVTVVKGTNTATVALADYVTGKQTATGTGYIKVDGAQKFLAGATWTADSNALNYTDTFNFFLDAKGLVIGTAKVAAAKVPTNIFYVTESKFVAGGTWGTDKAQLAVTYLDGTKAVVDMAITVTSGTKYINKDVALTDAAAANSGAGNYYGADFYKYTVDASGKIATIAPVGADHTVANETFVDNTAVSFAKGSAAVTWVASPSNLTFYADEATTVTTITTRGVVTTTGYANFAAKDFTSVNVLMEYKGNEVKAIYILGDAFAAEGSQAVVGVKVSVGDTYYNATAAKFYTDVVYNVKGVNTTYTVERGLTADASLTTPAFAEIVVTAGVAALTDATASGKAMYDKTNEDVEKVTASYMVIDGAAKYFASDVAFYDVTNVAKNGVVAIDGVAENDIVNYTTKTVAGATVVDAVYVTYAAQEDGVVAIDPANAAAVAYYADVLGLNPAALPTTGMPTVVQFTRPTTSYSSAVFKFWNAADVTDGSQANLMPSATWNGLPNIGVQTYGPTAAADGVLFNYEITFDGVVTQAGSFVMDYCTFGS